MTLRTAGQFVSVRHRHLITIAVGCRAGVESLYYPERDKCAGSDVVTVAGLPKFPQSLPSLACSVNVVLLSV
jgi:hypothetical protein